MVVTIVNQKAWIAINIMHAINDPGGWANIIVGITCQRQNAIAIKLFWMKIIVELSTTGMLDCWDI